MTKTMTAPRSTWRRSFLPSIVRPASFEDGRVLSADCVGLSTLEDITALRSWSDMPAGSEPSSCADNRLDCRLADPRLCHRALSFCTGIEGGELAWEGGGVGMGTEACMHHCAMRQRYQVSNSRAQETRQALPRWEGFLASSPPAKQRGKVISRGRKEMAVAHMHRNKTVKSRQPVTCTGSARSQPAQQGNISLSGLRSSRIIKKGRNTAFTCCSNTGPHANGHSSVFGTGGFHLDRLRHSDHRMSCKSRRSLAVYKSVRTPDRKCATFSGCVHMHADVGRVIGRLSSRSYRLCKVARLVSLLQLIWTYV